MRLLIIGDLYGQIGAASAIARSRGAKVAHVADIEAAMVALRDGQGADLVMIEAREDIEKNGGAIEIINGFQALFYLKHAVPGLKVRRTKSVDVGTQTQNRASLAQRSALSASRRHLEKVAALPAVDIDHSGGARSAGNSGRFVLV